MFLRSCARRAINKSHGVSSLRRQTPRPQPQTTNSTTQPLTIEKKDQAPPSPLGWERLYGTHSVEAALQVIAQRNGIHPHRPIRSHYHPTASQGTDGEVSIAGNGKLKLYIRDFRYAKLNSTHTEASHSSNQENEDIEETEAQSQPQKLADIPAVPTAAASAALPAELTWGSPSPPQSAATKLSTTIKAESQHQGISKNLSNEFISSCLPPKAAYRSLHRIVQLAQTPSLSRSIEIIPVERHMIRDLCDGERRNQNIVLEAPQFHPTLISVLPQCRDNDEVILYLDHIVDPMNIGAIVRAAYFFGVRRIVLSADCSSCTPVVSRSSAGTLEWMHVYRVVKSISTETILQQAVNSCSSDDTTAKSSGFSRIVAAVAAVPPAAVTTKHTSITSGDNNEKKNGNIMCGNTKKKGTLLVLGNEDRGLSDAVAALCTDWIHIPSSADPTYRARGLSLNVASSAAVILATLAGQPPLLFPRP